MVPASTRRETRAQLDARMYRETVRGKARSAFRYASEALEGAERHKLRTDCLREAVRNLEGAIENLRMELGERE